MENLSWDLLDFTVLGNAVLKWIMALALTLILLALLRFLKGKVSRFLMVLANKTTNQLDDVITDVFAKTKFIVLFAISVWAGSQVLNLPEGLGFAIRSVVVITVLIQVAVWGNSLVRYLVVTYVRIEEADEASRSAMTAALVFIGKLVLWSLVLLVGLQNLGVEVTALLASLGVGGIAVALASQNVLGDLFASLSIYFDRPFVVGDFIIVGDLLGTVERIGLKTTRLRSLQGEQLIFSNNDLLSSRIRNYKSMLERRVLFTIGVIYQTPYDKLVQIPDMIQEIIEQEELTRFDRAHFSSYGDSSLNFEIVYWVKVPDYNTYMDIQQRINLELFRRFREGGIDFAYPTRTLYMIQEDEISAQGARA